MKIVIIEDELIAAESLRNKILEIRPETEVLCILRSVRHAVEWLQTNETPDLLFMDIQLADGLSFCIFEEVQVRCPVVFTTSYDEYALRAFEVNCVDYLLKPVASDKLERAFLKIEQRLLSPLSNEQDTQDDMRHQIEQLLSSWSTNPTAYPRSILIPSGDKFLPMEVAQIAFIYSEMRMAKIYFLDGRSLMLEKSLDALQSQLNPCEFYRANRQYIISRKAIRDVSHWFKSKLRVNLLVTPPDDIIVSPTSASDFKRWLTQ